MAERRQTESPPEEESWGGWSEVQVSSDPKSPYYRVGLFLVQSFTAPVRHSSDVKQGPKKVQVLLSVSLLNLQLLYLFDLGFMQTCTRITRRAQLVQLMHFIKKLKFPELLRRRLHGQWTIFAGNGVPSKKNVRRKCQR